MRNFIISVICLGALIGVWAAFESYSSDKISAYMDTIEQEVIKTVEQEKWDTAYENFQRFSRDWHKYKKKAAFFLDTQAINEADYSIAKALYYIKAKDVSNSSGELSCLREQLKFLEYNESLAVGNIF